MSATVHEAFGLTRASYFVIPRLILEAMSEEWQAQFVALVEQAHERYEFDVRPYEVRMRGDRGRFVEDPLADYRHGHVPARPPTTPAALDSTAAPRSIDPVPLETPNPSLTDHSEVSP